MNKTCSDDAYTYSHYNVPSEFSNMNNEYTFGEDKIYLFQEADETLRPVSFSAEQLSEIEVPAQSNVDYRSALKQHSLVDKETELDCENDSDINSTPNVQIIEPSNQNILVAQSITNLIPINQNVRLYAIDDGSTTNICQPIIINKRLISVPSQNMPVISHMPVTFVETAEGTFQNSLIKIISSDSFREENIIRKPLKNASYTFKTQLQTKVVESKPDLISSTNGINSPKPCNFSCHVINGSQNSRDTQKIKAVDIGNENGKKCFSNHCKDSSKRSAIPIIAKEPHTTIHLLQNGNEYQSVEQLDEDKLKLVAGAINRVANKKAPKNTVIYDPASKTKIIYRVVYPEDLNLSTKANMSPQLVKPALKRALSKQPIKDNTAPCTTRKVASITRSGRIVKQPRHMDDDTSPQPMPKSVVGQGKETTVPPKENKEKSIFEGSNLSTQQRKKKEYINIRCQCAKCKKVFRGCKRINKHYLEFPDHKITSSDVVVTASYSTSSTIPVASTTQACNSNVTEIISEDNPKIPETSYNKIDSKGLFEHLVNLLESTDLDKRASLFVQELESLVTKLRELVPCVVRSKEITSGSQCIVGETVASLLDIKSGAHYFDMNAIKCTSNSETCDHKTNLKNNTEKNTWFPKNFGSINETQKELRNCARTNTFDKWLLDVGKNKDDTLSPHKSQSDQTKVCWSTLSDSGNLPATFSTPSSNGGLLRSETISQKVDSLEKNSFSETWMQDVVSGSKNNKQLQLSNKIQCENLTVSEVTSDITFLNNLDQQFVYATSSVNIPMDIDEKNMIEPVQRNEIGTKFNFQNSPFKFGDDRLNSDHGSFEKLPSFMKIERHNGLRMPTSSLEDIDLNASGLKNDANVNLPNISPNGVLSSMQSPKLHLETLNSDFHLSSELEINAPHHMDNISRDSSTRKNVSLETNDNACDERPLMDNLSTSISETPLCRSETLLSINDSSLDSTRLNLSGNQSVLQLLDPLGTDCLSFSDPELRPTSQMSLDLPLDLFPFHHT